MRNITLIAMLGLATCTQANWPQFRGPNAAGVAEGTGLPDSWDQTKNVAWKVPIPGLAWSCPIVWGDRVFITSVVGEAKRETPKKGLYFLGERPKPEDAHRWMVYCLDFKTGKTIWEREVHKGVPTTSVHLKNTFGSETPVTDGERIYAYFGNVGLYCFDMNGEPLWSKKFDTYKTYMGWGTASSPLLYKDRIYILEDNEEKSAFVAFDKKTGNEVWRVPREERTSWATPFIWENEKRAELVTCGPKRVRSYDLDGKLLWEFKGMSNLVIPTPLTKFGLLYISSGYVGDMLRPLYTIKPGASGDISLKENETTNEYIVWCNKKAGPYNPSPIIYGDYVYVLYDRGLLACFDAKTGKEIYERQRLDKNASAFTSSPWAYNGKIFCLSEDGDTFVVQAGKEFKILGKNSLDEMCMATPAIANGSLLIRTMGHLYRIQSTETSAQAK